MNQLFVVSPDQCRRFLCVPIIVPVREPVLFQMFDSLVGENCLGNRKSVIEFALHSGMARKWHTRASLSLLLPA